MDLFLIITAAILVISYSILIVLLTIGWIRLKKPSNYSLTSFPFVSAIIPARNEEKTIQSLLIDIVAQNYPSDRFEVLIIDDFSEDDTQRVITDFVEKKGLKNFFLMRKTSDHIQGKKSALKYGIEQAKGEIIITTDADCRMGENWLYSMAGAFQENEVQMVIGPVHIDSEEGWFSRFQSLEFMSLTGATGGSSYWHQPVMCNGANLGFLKSSYLNLLDSIPGNKYASGDDVFLLHAVKKTFPGKVIYLKDTDALVITKPAQKITDFFSQRRRWASKAGGYNDIATIIVGLIVAGFNIFLTILFILVLVSGGIFTYIFIISWAVKLFVDYTILYQVSKFLKAMKLIRFYPILQLLYPFYVSATLLLSLFPYSWKQKK